MVLLHYSCSNQQAGDSVRVYLAEVDRGRCALPNILAVVAEVRDDGMYKLATKDGYLLSYYAR